MQFKTIPSTGDKPGRRLIPYSFQQCKSTPKIGRLALVLEVKLITAFLILISLYERAICLNLNSI